MRDRRLKPDALNEPARCGLEPLELRVLLSGAFGPAQLIWSDPAGASAVQIVDVDGDDDAIAASVTAARLTLHGNLGGGSLGPERVVSAVPGQPGDG
jgi:hypothetical protein